MHDHALVADESVEQRRLADVRPADEGNRCNDFALALDGWRFLFVVVSGLLDGVRL